MIDEHAAKDIRDARNAGATQQDVADRFNVSRSLVSLIESGKVWGVPDGELWPLPNVWIGASVEDQATADERIPVLLTMPAAIRFISAEPLLGPLDIRAWIGARSGLPTLDLAIIGGESGPKARPCDVDWIRSLVGQCDGTSTKAFVKQLGARPVCEQRDCPACGGEAVDTVAMFEHEESCDYAGHDILDDGGGRCTTCGITLPPCSTCGPYHGQTPPTLHLLDAKGGDMSEWPEDLRIREMPKGLPSMWESQPAPAPAVLDPEEELPF